MLKDHFQVVHLWVIKSKRLHSKGIETMKVIFVDAENIGLKEIERITASIVDKVFVFSKSDAVKLICEKSLYLSLSDYPSGANQADFYIISYLTRFLTALEKKQINLVSFELYSNDENLISAFIFQCDQLGAKSEIHRTKEQSVVPISNSAKPQNASSAELKLLKALNSPQAFDLQFQQQLGLAKPVFTKTVNELHRDGKIMRDPDSKKKWVRC